MALHIFYSPLPFDPRPEDVVFSPVPSGRGLTQPNLTWRKPTGKLVFVDPSVFYLFFIRYRQLRRTLFWHYYPHLCFTYHVKNIRGSPPNGTIARPLLSSREGGTDSKDFLSVHGTLSSIMGTAQRSSVERGVCENEPNLHVERWRNLEICSWLRWKRNYSYTVVELPDKHI